MTEGVAFRFVNYGEPFEPSPGVLVLDVGMRTIPGVIDHHHPGAEPECAASLIIRHPELVLDHIPPPPERPDTGARWLEIVTHRLPDFDAVSAIFLALRLIASRRLDEPMRRLGAYAKLADSGSLPKDIELCATPYSILRALFAQVHGPDIQQAGARRVGEGLKLMRFLYEWSGRGEDITANRRLFGGVDRFARAMAKCEADYLDYLLDRDAGKKVWLGLPLSSGQGRKEVDGLLVRNPRSFLLKEWARRDREGSRLGRGFSFTMTDFGEKRFILGVDPEAGVHLKGLGTLLNAREAAKRQAAGRPFPHPWYEGNCPLFDWRIIDSPQDETSLFAAEIEETVREFGR